MSDGRNGHECRGDLVAREQRGDLSAADRLALGAHLASCASCRLTREIRADFEVEGAIEVDDATRIARLSAAARRWSQRRARPTARRWPRASALRSLVFSLAALLTAGTASATVWWWRSGAHATAPHAQVPSPSAPPARARPRRAAPAHAAVDPPAPPVLAVESPAPPSGAALTEVQHARVHRREIAARAPTEAGASSLLRLAGEARHRGDLELALTLYRRLQRAFGDTREATLSSVPLGGILLQEGQAARALEQYERYVASDPHGNLVPEALYGRGRALAALGRSGDERETWRRLLEQSPGSAYESHARRRLDQLQTLK